MKWLLLLGLVSLASISGCCRGGLFDRGYYGDPYLMAPHYPAPAPAYAGPNPCPCQ